MTIALFLQPALLSSALLLAIARQAVPLGLIALGQSIVMRCRSIDLSAGGVVVATSYILTSGYLPVSDTALIGVCLVFGVAVGAVNGLLVARLGASAVIVTLAIGGLTTGALIAASQYRAPGEAPELIRYLGIGRIDGMPVAILVWIGALLPCAAFLRFTVFGINLDSIGSNPTAATISGLPLRRVVFLAHIISAVMAVLAGIVLVGFVGVGSTNIGGELVLNSLAAVILGGVNFGSGGGKVLGPAVGAFMLTFLSNILTSFGFDVPAKLIIQGAVVAIAVLMHSTKTR
ncbi:ABC transporter permease [Bradyrhizobium japonicum]|uniref:ABC transporter permease n=1 Tax=Bradyrhizobium japonicum TaxID=375 RepID=UPI001CB7518A|nr:ABC transporter permease [Bradyrhizobium japonicum]